MPSKSRKQRPENEAYRKWKASGSDVDLERLVACLRRHARAVVYTHVSPYDPNLAEEIVAKALLREKTFRGEAEFATWFHRLARNHCNDALRRRRDRSSERSLDSLGGDDFLALDDKWAYADVDFRFLMESLVKHLDATERELLERRIDGEKLEEIGQCWGMPLPTIKTRWFRLRSKLQQLITAST